MKIMFCVLPAYGHVYPVMPLALAARDAGHEVTVATTDVFVPKMAALGLATIDVGMTVEQARDQLLASLSSEEMPKSDDGRPDIEMGGRLFIDIAGRRTAGELAPHLRRRRPGLVVYEPYDVGAAVAAHAAGIPAVCHALSPRLPDSLMRAMAGDHLGRLWADHGVVNPSFDVFTGDAYLDIVPTALQEPSFLTDPRRLPVRPVPFAEPGAPLPAWVGERDRPLVYLTLGTVVATDDVLRPVIDGLGELDADVLLALGAADGATLGSVPRNVHVEHFVDQPAVLAHAALAVHHGGSGTTIGALTHGVPQLILPKGADQFWNADAMVRADLAAVLEPAEITPETITRAAAAELGNLRPPTLAVIDEIAAMPTPAAVLDQLIDRFGEAVAA